MPRVILFDVNETLLDLQALDLHFQRLFGAAAVRKLWFAQVLQSALVATLTDAYVDFGTVGGAALDMTAARLGVQLSTADRSELLGAMLTLPPHPEVSRGLERLRDAGLRLAALTNSTAQAATAQLTHAGLFDFFEQVLSVDAVRRFKPAAEPYRHAASSLGVETRDIRMVAAHDWDVAGAMRVGCAGAFVARPGMVLNPVAPRPDIIGEDLLAVSEQILRIELGPR